jgi:hypothetical protein
MEIIHFIYHFIESVVYMWCNQIFFWLNLLLHNSICLLISLNLFKVVSLGLTLSVYQLHHCSKHFMKSTFWNNLQVHPLILLQSWWHKHSANGVLLNVYTSHWTLEGRLNSETWYVSTYICIQHIIHDIACCFLHTEYLRVW